jgi:hypothetical protein
VEGAGAECKANPPRVSISDLCVDSPSGNSRARVADRVPRRAGIAAVWLTDQTFSDTLKNDAATRKGHSKVLRVGVILTILAFTFGQPLGLSEVGFA